MNILEQILGTTKDSNDNREDRIVDGIKSYWRKESLEYAIKYNLQEAPEILIQVLKICAEAEQADIANHLEAIQKVDALIQLKHIKDNPGQSKAVVQ